MNYSRITRLFMALALFAGLFILSPVGAQNYHVAFVYDGDTILLQDGRKIRYLGIDTPEIDHENGNDAPFSRDARDFNRELVNGKIVTLEYDRQTKDRYKRILAYVFIEGGEMVNALMVKSGLAYVLSCRPNLRYRSYLMTVQRQAIQERLGIWKNLSMDEETKYRGNKKSFRFHRLSCPSGKQIAINSRITFPSMYDAFWQGYSPCDRCLPRWFDQSTNSRFDTNSYPQERREPLSEAPHPAHPPQGSDREK